MYLFRIMYHLKFLKLILILGTSESSLPESPEEQHFTHVKPTNHYDIQRQNFMYGGGGAGQFWNQHR